MHKVPLIEIVIPIRTVSESNMREHWSAKHKRHRQQKGIVTMYLRHNGEIQLPCIIKILRTSKRFLDDDNLVASMKSIRDAIAEFITPGLAPGRADDNKSISWQYDQIKGDYAVIIQVFAIPIS